MGTEREGERVFFLPTPRSRTLPPSLITKTILSRSILVNTRHSHPIDFTGSCTIGDPQGPSIHRLNRIPLISCIRFRPPIQTLDRDGTNSSETSQQQGIKQDGVVLLREHFLELFNLTLYKNHMGSTWSIRRAIGTAIFGWDSNPATDKICKRTIQSLNTYPARTTIEHTSLQLIGSYPGETSVLLEPFPLPALGGAWDNQKHVFHFLTGSEAHQ